MRATITLSSEVFGEETFKYDTLKEGRAGFKRLEKSCKTQFEKDKIERDLRLVGSDGATRVFLHLELEDESEGQDRENYTDDQDRENYTIA